MLGAVGFLVLAVVVGAYAHTSSVNYKLVPSKERQLFVSAYSILAITALVWFIAFFSSEEAVSKLVFMSDIMLVAATVCMVGVIIDITKPFVLAALTLAGSGLLTVRAFVVPSQAFVADNLLNFNLSQTESLVIGLLFLVVWLPATIKVVYSAFQTPALLPYRGPISFVFISTVLMTSFFLSARRPVMIVLTFVSIIIFFSLLIGVNALLARSISKSKNARVHHG